MEQLNSFDGQMEQYRAVAKHYEIPVFSFAKVRDNSDNSKILEMLKYYDLHVPWHVHMMIGDIISNFFHELITQKCTASTTEADAIGGLLIRPTTAQNEFKPLALKPLYKQPENELTCATGETAYLLEKIADDRTISPRGGDLVKFEESLSTWTEYSDFKVHVR
jgi:hypothetical protein